MFIKEKERLKHSVLFIILTYYKSVSYTHLDVYKRQVLSYLFIDKLGLAAVALATGAGWAGLIGGYSWIYAGCIKKKKG